MRIKVRNVLGCETADLVAQRISLVGGHNGAGKSSLLDAIACAVTGTHAIRGVKTKKDAAAAVRDGAPAGAVAIEWGDEHAGGSQRVTWPDGEVQAKGRAVFLGSPLGIGAVRWMDLSEKVRATEMADRLSLHPKREHLAAFLADSGLSDETIAALWALVEDQGWDAAHRKAQDQAARLRGRWEQVTRVQFGAKKADGWRPPLLDDENIYSEDTASQTVTAARDKVEGMVAAGAISSDAVERARAAAANLGPAQAKEKAARAKLAQADGALEKARRDLADAPGAEQVAHTYPCPHCQKPLLLRRRAASEPYRVEIPPPEISNDEAKRRRLRLQALESSIKSLEEDVAEATREVQAALAEIKVATDATARLAEIEAKPQVNAAQLAAARADLARAESVLEAIRCWEQSKQIFAEWRRSQPAIEALSPTGVRASRVAAAVSAFNERLAAISAYARFPRVAVAENTDAMLGGRPYSLLSESEKWRVDLVLTLAFAELERASVVLVDRLDILTPQARPGVFMALRQIGIPGVVCMTAKEASAIPALQRVKAPDTGEAFGVSYWIENGRLAPVE